jgi:hypothetical protein
MLLTRGLIRICKSKWARCRGNATSPINKALPVRWFAQHAFFFLTHVVICVAMAQQMANMLPAGMVQQMGGKRLVHTINNTSTTQHVRATIGMGNIMEMVKQFGGAGGPGGGGGMAELMQQAAAMAGGGGGRGGGAAAARGGGRGRRRR